ncbi:hypothetical protein GWK47_039498 [Chionoecetes opilio]|uniref:Uncharacterized protein n=1 Tax=Chionoecetes opilio TaxID=41210 RepID=A0A8J5D0C3_CHIOP|nr:hypothetical protein GWK47_039498 [Chionoecetes opilio]
MSWDFDVEPTQTGMDWFSWLNSSKKPIWFLVFNLDSLVVSTYAVQSWGAPAPGQLCILAKFDRSGELLSWIEILAGPSRHDPETGNWTAMPLTLPLWVLPGLDQLPDFLQPDNVFPESKSCTADKAPSLAAAMPEESGDPTVQPEHGWSNASILLFIETFRLHQHKFDAHKVKKYDIWRTSPRPYS